jgi:hypothetical protein
VKVRGWWSPAQRGITGTTRTCNLRIRSRPTAVHAVSHSAVPAGRVRCAVQLIRPGHRLLYLAE